MPSRDLDAESAAREHAKGLEKWRAETAAELDAMSRAFDLLHELPRDSQGRVLKWLEGRLDNRSYYTGECPF